MPVIEVLSSGFGVVNRRVWLILVPLLLDFLLWLGPQVTAAPVAYQGVELFDRLAAGAPAAEEATLPLGREQVQNLFAVLGQVNLLKLLATPLLFDILASPLPSLMATGAAAVPSPTAFSWGVISDGRSLMAVWLGLAAASYLLASLYLSAIARSVAGGVQPRWLPEALRGWRRLGLFALLVVAVALLLGLPLALVVSVAGLVVPEVVPFLETGVTVGVVALAIGLFFVNPALFVGGAGVVEAIRQSLALVRRRLGASLGFIVVVTVIQWGITLAWSPLLGHPAGVLVAMVGNAYIATGLAAAVMIFYQERVKELVK